MVGLWNSDRTDQSEHRLGKCSGSCHCGRIKVQLILKNGDGSVLRACSCGFCRKHASVMMSVPEGLMILELPARVDFYRIGGITEFHVCSICGVFVAATWNDGDKLLGTVNLNALDQGRFFGQPTPLDFDHESVNDQKARRRETWMPVHIVEPFSGDAGGNSPEKRNGR